MELTVNQALRQGVAAHKKGKLQDAERFYRSVLQANPNHPDANHNLGVLAVAVGKPLEAIPLFKLALDANLQIEQFWLSYIDVLIRLERFDEAKRVLVDGEEAGVSSNKLDALHQRLKENILNYTNDTAKDPALSEKRKKLVKKKKRGRTKARAASSSPAPSQDQINRLLGPYKAGRFKFASVGKYLLALVNEGDIAKACKRVLLCEQIICYQPNTHNLFWRVSRNRFGVII